VTDPRAPEEPHRRAYEIGARRAELAGILRRISRRAVPDPTDVERERIEVLKDELASLANGEWV
jgi:hypothetical protein